MKRDDVELGLRLLVAVGTIAVWLFYLLCK